MFAAIVFLVVILLWAIFFSVKYYREVMHEQGDFYTLIHTIATKEVSVNQLKHITNRMEGRFMGKRWDPRSPSRLDPQFGFLNHIHLDADYSVISSDVKESIHSDSLFGVLDEPSGEILMDDGFLLSRLDLDGGESLIIFKKLHYSFEDYISDILVYLFVSLIFGALIYYAGKRFVDEAFTPVEENIRDMKQFVHHAGHELKTPLSVMDGNLQLLTQEKKYSAQMFKEIRKEVQHMNHLIEWLLELSDLHPTWKKDTVYLLSVVQEVLGTYAKKIQKQQLQIELDISADISISSNHSHLHILVSNLISNAVKYSHKKGKIGITYTYNTLSIQDNGVWVWEEELPKLFDSFYKGKYGKKKEGFGIGLSLVKKIVDMYGWKIEVKNQKDWGMEFRVIFKQKLQSVNIYL